MKKVVVFKVDLHDGKDKRKAMKAAATVTGIDSISVETKEGTMTVIGEDVDSIAVVRKLRKLFWVDIDSVGPAKQPEKKVEEDPPPPPPKETPEPEKKKKKKKEKEVEGEKEAPAKKKEGTKKEGSKEKVEKEKEKEKEAKEEEKNVHGYGAVAMNDWYRAPYNCACPYHPVCYHVHSSEESPSFCVIC